MAVQDPTTNYSWDLPNVNGDDGVWGGRLREILGDDVTGLDAVVKAISDVANAALARAGGTMTGNLKVLTATYTLVNLGTGQSGAQALNLSNGNYFAIGISGATTFTISNPPAAGDVEFFMLEVDGTAAITWPLGTVWSDGSPPTLGVGKDVFTFWTRDGGTTWIAAHAVQNAS